MGQPLSVPPGKKVRLAEFDPGYHDLNRARAEAETDKNVEAIGPLAERLYAEHTRALLLVLQGMDTSGKDGTIRNVMRGVSPQSCQVTPFREPTHEEFDHDFLWRVHLATPRRGNIGIFNRSHYEDVLVVCVKKLVPKSVWQTRYGRINDFERLLVESGTAIVKVFLHISKEEQRERLQARIDDPEKRWKFRAGDLDDRKLWDDYQRAYEAALTRCNTERAPWYIVPADHKWYRNFVVSRLVVEALEELDPQFPPPTPGIEKIVVE